MPVILALIGLFFAFIWPHIHSEAPRTPPEVQARIDAASKEAEDADRRRYAEDQERLRQNRLDYEAMQAVDMEERKAKFRSIDAELEATLIQQREKALKHKHH